MALETRQDTRPSLVGSVNFGPRPSFADLVDIMKRFSVPEKTIEQFQH